MLDEYVSTDLASECRDMHGTGQIPGVRFSQSQSAGVTISRIEIRESKAAKQMGKPMGTYVTLTFGAPHFLDGDAEDVLCGLLAENLKQMLYAASPQVKTVLVAGLGNRRITADAVGPLTVDRILVTRHLESVDLDLFCRVGQLSVAALAPGVLGDTGVEAAEIVKQMARTVSADVVIAVDALAARHVDRLGCTVQLADSGIEPGSGVGNRRMALSLQTIGCPVIAVGVPTVVNSATLVRDALEAVGVATPDAALKKALDNKKSFFVTLKESDASVDAMARILARSLDMALVAEEAEV